MSWLAKLNLNSIVERLGTFRSSLLLIALIVTCFFCGYRIGNFFHGFQQTTLHQMQQRLDHLYQQQEEHIRRINTLEVELEVERLANQKSQNLLTEIEQQHFKVKTELAFYEKVMAPEKQADGLVIDKLTLSSTASPRHYRFQVVLVQQKVRKRFAKGHIKLVLHGSLKDKPVKLELSKISEITKKQLGFSFQYFQIIEGELTLPEHFSPDQIELSAVMPKSKWQAYQRIDQSYSWADVVQTPKQTTSLILD
ncbi:DUF6776 family protein [Thalassotalea sediminis]|uniref:DUF6776 family protein n=1 Tax=Thalassotalea sediminis TaxID=1759089 RepID=UPI002572BBF8|nr:DUF6776 family protein [Thalassotalea sediminis]